MSEMYAIAFFPWVSIERKVKLGHYELQPYSALHTKHHSSNKEVLDFLDRIFSCYSYGAGETVKNPIVIVKDLSFSSFTPDDINDLYHVRNILAYSAICTNYYTKEQLPNKKIHVNVGSYYNSAIFDSFIQTFSLESDHTTVFFGRRYGQEIVTGPLKWSRFYRPPYARSISSEKQPIMNYDEKVFKGLSFTLMNYRTNKDLSRILLALDWFFNAHMEVPTIPFTNEIIMMAIAFETLLDIPEFGKRPALMDIIHKLFKDFESTEGPFKWRAGNKWKEENRPWKERWICNFYELRNKIVHGEVIPIRDFKWVHNEHWTHLEIADTIFDLIIRIMMESESFYELSKEEKAKCDALDDFLSKDCLSMYDCLQSYLDKRCIEDLKRKYPNVFKSNKNMPQ